MLIDLNAERPSSSACGSTKEALETNVESANGGEMDRELRDDNSEKPQLVNENLQPAEFLNSTTNGEIISADTGKDDKAISLKRKRTDLNMDCGDSAMITDKDTGVAHGDSSPSRLEDEIDVKRCGTCGKSQRYWSALLVH